MSDKKKTYKPANELEEGALFYHMNPKPGKMEITATKPMGNQRDLALAYSPGVAAPCLHIEVDPEMAAQYTGRANLVAVISNGTAVLGLGNIGPLASKPVMEGKAVLFKKFADVNVFDIEVDQTDVDKFCDVVAALEPTFGGINLEDISAPECFLIEEQLRERMKIPVFHDDQHGTAIIVAAGVRNGLEVAKKNIADVKIVASGAGAASIACLNLLVSMGAKRENIWVSDSKGVVWDGRNESMDRYKQVYAQKTDKRDLAEIMPGADVFIGLSAAGVLKPEMLKEMKENPIVMALANPTPEIMPELAREARPDAMICTGRSDYPNQVNNVLCFPFIFRGALDVGATTINEEMKIAAVEAIGNLTREEPSEAAAGAYGGVTPRFGPDYLIPSPFDPRLILRIAPSVAKAAMDSGVATRPITDWDTYNDTLNRFVFRSGMIMKPIIEKATNCKKRVIFSDGEDERVLRAAEIAIQDKLCQPILIGRPDVIQQRLERFGLSIRPGKDFEIINPERDDRYHEYVNTLVDVAGRDGITPDAAKNIIRSNTTAIGAIAIIRDDADAMICGLEGRFFRHRQYIDQIIGRQDGLTSLHAMSLLIDQKRALFMTDTYIAEDPDAQQIAEMTRLAAKEIERFGIVPKAALLSASDFGSRPMKTSKIMREAAEILFKTNPELEVDGEMHGDSALDEDIRDKVYPMSRLKGKANLLVFPNLDAANITMNVAKEVSDGLHVGPIILGTKRPAHILPPAVTSRGVLNMTALAAVQAVQYDEESK